MCRYARVGTPNTPTSYQFMKTNPFRIQSVNLSSSSLRYHSAGKHDRRPYTYHTIYPLYYYTPFTVLQALRLTESSSAGIFQVQNILIPCQRWQE